MQAAAQRAASTEDKVNTPFEIRTLTRAHVLPLSFGVVPYCVSATGGFSVWNCSVVALMLSDFVLE